MDRLNEKLRALGQRAHADVEQRPVPQPPVRRVRRQRLAIVGSVGALACLLVATTGWLLLRPERSTEVAHPDEWVAVASVEEARERSVMYVEEHEVFVVRMVDDFIALSARTTAGDEQRVLYCTVSNLFESEPGVTFDRAGVPLEGPYEEGLKEVELRVREDTIEIAPTRVTSNDSRSFGGAVGPPCGEWGDVVEGPPGFALATDIPPEENEASIDPARLEVGQQAELRFAPGPQTSGLVWHVFRFDDPLWRWIGVFTGGPGYPSRFYLSPRQGGADDIGFGGNYTIDLKVPKLERGAYRLMTDAIRSGNGPLEERTSWHYAEFEVVD